MTFAAPWAFALIPLVAFRLMWTIISRRRGTGAFRFSSLMLVSARPTLRTFFTWLPLLAETVGMILLVIALARPQRITYSTAERYGIDLVVALDASGSMAAEDFLPRNRLAVAKELIASFIEKRIDDRIGIISFGTRAATRVPITFDHDVAQQALGKVKVGENGDGTAIGQAIATSVLRLERSRSRSRVIVLVTDGVNNAGSIDPVTAAALAARMKIKIYSIGVGSKGPVPIPIKVEDRFSGEVKTEYQWIRGEIDEEMLQKISGETGGAFFRAVDRNSLAAVLGRIDELEKSRLTAPRQADVHELYLAPLAWGLALLVFAYTTGETVWMRLPA
jgi:Ca-activated chloride channel family protein